MELKVWVEGIQRIVCGVTDSTSCQVSFSNHILICSVFSDWVLVIKTVYFSFVCLQDVVYALAAATGKTGRFTLIERWRNNERLLSPNENPLKVKYTVI